jgi:hypothetical protein
MNENLKDRGILLVREKSSKELKVAGKDGKVKAANMEGGDNPDFLKIDKQGNLLDNFFENFKRQFKAPTRFEFFRLPVDKLKEAVQQLQEAFKNPDKTESKAYLDMHRVNPEDFLKKQTQANSQTDAQTSGQIHAIAPNQVKWEKLEKFGVTREALEKTGNLDKLLDYKKTDLMPVVMKFEGETLRSDARFSLHRQEDGTFAPAIHLIRHKPELARPYFGIEFTEEDKQNLLKTGNLGRVVEAEFKAGEKTPILLSIDRQTNEPVAFRKEWLKVPDTYKGVQLNEEQKQKLGNGEAVRIEGMTSANGKKIDGEVQFNADKRYFALNFDDNKKQSQRQVSGQNYPPKTFRNKELTEAQRSSLREGKTVHTGELIDSKGKKYSGYVSLNKESGRLDFMFPKDYRDALAAAKIIPDERHKTQIAKNNEGKTTEATKNIKEPLNSAQTQPTEKQAAKQKEKKDVKNVKSKGMKI